MKSSSVRTVAALLVGLAGVAGAASVILTSGKTSPKAQPANGGAAKPGTGPALGYDGRVLPVGMTSSIPQTVGYDTGPLDYTYNAPGWDYYPVGLGGR